jgi:adenine/guanine phosphoribosyltransferase-like PRPP-binding protein
MEKAKNWLRRHKRLLAMTKRFKRAITPSRMTTCSITQSFNMIEEWARAIPNEFDVIIGVPRAGLFMGNIIASKFGRPLSTPDYFLRGEVWFSNDAMKPEIVRRVLVVDDSLTTGSRLAKILEKLRATYPEIEYKIAVLFVSPSSRGKVDFCYKVEKPPYVFEWNLLTSCGGLGKIATDMDGVLCVNCPPDVDADEDKYRNWLETAAPYLIPSFRIEAIISSRLEKYRPETEAWLNAHDVKYNQLLMLKLQDKSEKNSENVIGFKVSALKKVLPFWYWESDLDEAKAIHARTGLPVLCVDYLTILQ